MNVVLAHGRWQHQDVVLEFEDGQFYAYKFGTKEQVPVDDVFWVFTLVNCTPHKINILIGENREIIIQPTGFTVRCDQSIVNDGVLVEWDIPLTRKVIKDVEIIPPKLNGIYWLVSLIAKSRLTDRDDILVTGEAIRDAGGNIIGCSGLSR